MNEDIVTFENGPVKIVVSTTLIIKFFYKSYWMGDILQQDNWLTDFKFQYVQGHTRQIE